MVATLRRRGTDALRVVPVHSTARAARPRTTLELLHPAQDLATRYPRREHYRVDEVDGLAQRRVLPPHEDERWEDTMARVYLFGVLAHLESLTTRLVLCSMGELLPESRWRFLGCVKFVNGSSRIGLGNGRNGIR